MCECLPVSSLSVACQCAARAFSSWLIVEVPEKSGLSSTISAKMHPILHMSTAAPYLDEPTRISGARYLSAHTRPHAMCAVSAAMRRWRGGTPHYRGGGKTT